MLELLERIAKVFKDYCGVLTEESIRKNFILLYELLDEMIDYGYPQSTSTETLKMYVHNEPVAVAAPSATNSGILTSKRTVSSTAVQRPISLLSTGGSGGEKKNEIYVDILERLTVLFNANGYVLNSTIDGCIQMKSYLQGNPGLRFALNEDLVVGKENATGGYGGGGPALVLDDCNFHECANLDDFETGRTVALIPPEGEFVVMNYRITSEFRAPFRIFPTLTEESQYKVELFLRVRADIPEKNHGTNVVIRFPVPKTATTVIPEVGAESGIGSGGSGLRGGSVGGGAAQLASATAAAAGLGQTAEYDSKERQVVWTIKKFQGGQEHTLRTRISLGQPSGSTLRKELGPISATFEIPMYNVSNLQVKYLKIAETSKNFKPHRWVRYVSTSNSYVCRL
jgi:AP-4 complex subunit mu-1